MVQQDRLPHLYAVPEIPEASSSAAFLHPTSSLWVAGLATNTRQHGWNHSEEPPLLWLSRYVNNAVTTSFFYICYFCSIFGEHEVMFCRSVVGICLSFQFVSFVNHSMYQNLVCFSHFSPAQALSWWCRCVMWCMFTSSCRLVGRRSSAITTSVSTTPPARLAPTTPSYMKKTWSKEWTWAPTLTSTPMDESRCLVWASWTALRQREVYPTTDWAAKQSTQTQCKDCMRMI